MAKRKSQPITEASPECKRTLGLEQPEQTVAEAEAVQATVSITIPVGDKDIGGYLDRLPRYISGTGLSRNTLAKRGLRRIHRALVGRAKLSTGRVVETRSQVIQWLLERVAEAEAG